MLVILDTPLTGEEKSVHNINLSELFHQYSERGRIVVQHLFLSVSSRCLVLLIVEGVL